MALSPHSCANTRHQDIGVVFCISMLNYNMAHPAGGGQGIEVQASEALIRDPLRLRSGGF